MKKIFISILGLGLLFGAYKTYQFYKNERAREASNYANLLKEFKEIDSLYGASQIKLITYQFKKDQELREYLETTNNQLNGLSKDLKAANIKLKRITQITSTSIAARDTIVNTINLDSLKQKINTLPSFSIPIFDKTPCFEISGSLNFNGLKSSIIFDSRKFTDTITRVDSWSRKKHRWVFGFKTGLFGKKLLHRNEFSKCTGKTNTIIIHKKK